MLLIRWFIWGTVKGTFYLQYIIKLGTVLFLKCYITFILQVCKRIISELFNKNGSKDINQQIKWFVDSLEWTKFPKNRNVSWMKPVIPSNQFKTCKTQERYWYSCVTLRKIFCSVWRIKPLHSPTRILQ